MSGINERRTRRNKVEAPKGNPDYAFYGELQGSDTKLSWLGKVLDFVRSLDFRTTAFALTAVSLTAIGTSPALASRELSPSAAALASVVAVVLGIVGVTAILIEKRECNGTDCKGETYKPPDT